MTEIYTGADFKAHRMAIGWHRTVVASKLGCDEGTIRKLEAAASVPVVLRLWIEPIAATARIAPAPRETWLASSGRKRL